MTTRIKHYNPGASDLVADWHVLDASGEVLGRFATKVAWLLMGKHKPGYIPHLLSGDFVVVTNASSVRVTGDKIEQKVYVRHSQYPGNRREIPLGRMMETHPTRVIEHAVKGMLPKNKLGHRMLSRLKVYAGTEHPHEAQVTGAERMRARLAERAEAPPPEVPAEEAPPEEAPARPVRRPRTRAKAPVEEAPPPEAPAEEAPAEETPPRPARRRRTRAKAPVEEAPPPEAPAEEAPAEEAPARPARRRRTRARTTTRGRSSEEAETESTEDAGEA